MNEKILEKYDSIPAEKFRFVENKDNIHDKKLDTKPHSYAYDAFLRFCKNKGSVVAAVIIILLVLFAIIAPWCTPYTVGYYDNYFAGTLPKCSLFANTNFWDGCSNKTDGYLNYSYYYWMGQELIGTEAEDSAHFAIKNQNVQVLEDNMYSYRLDSYQMNGCKYLQVSRDDYELIQEYQNLTGRQVIYPTIRVKDRPSDKSVTDATRANYYYLTESIKNKPYPVLDENGQVIPVYWTATKDQLTDNYNSLRVEGEDGFVQDGETYYYVYARNLSGGDVELRVNYFEYYTFKHSYQLKDGISEPYFLFGSTRDGNDVFVCLASGARFSFIFAICIAAINMVFGAIYGAIEGYYGGAADLVMERISDILSAVPMMIVITLLKYHMDSSPQMLVLFLAFIATGWIGMASSTRMQFYRFKNQEYVLAARTLGAKDWRIIWKHIFPNALGTLVTSCALVIPSMIFSETSLTYLGIIDLSSGNITSVGTLIAKGQSELTTYPHIAMFPSVFLSLLMLSFNLFGNGLRDAFNPSLRGVEE